MPEQTKSMKKELGYLVLGGVIASVLTSGLVYAQSVSTTNTDDASVAPCHQERGGDGIFGKMNKEEMLNDQAEILGMTTVELQAALDDGQKFHEIAESKGITQAQMHEKMQVKMKEHLAELVASGAITQEQMDQHLERMANKPEGNGFGMRGHKFGERPMESSPAQE